MTDLRTAAQQALEALENAEDQLAKPYSTDASKAITALRAALAQQAEPVPGKVVAWGIFALTDGEWQLQHPVFVGDECGKENAEFERASYSGPQPLEVRPLGVVTAAAQQAEPVGAVLVNRESREGVMFYSVDMIPDPATLKDRFELVKVYTAPPQRKPLTDEEIERLWYPSAAIAEPGKRRVAFGRAVERAHGIKE